MERDAQRDDMWGVYTVAEVGEGELPATNPQVCEETLRAQGKPAVPGLPGTTATSAGEPSSPQPFSTSYTSSPPAPQGASVMGS